MKARIDRRLIILSVVVLTFVAGLWASQVWDSPLSSFTRLDAQSVVLSADDRIMTPAYRRKLQTLLRRFDRCKSDSQKAVLGCVDTVLAGISKEFGARVGLDAAVAETRMYPFLIANSHDLSHTVGLYSLRYNPTDAAVNGDILVMHMGRALVDCYDWGVMGCMHGVIEAGIAKLPKEKRTEVVMRACMENPEIAGSQVYRNHCLHWAGHGMALFTDQTLLETLDDCSALDKNFESTNVQLCISGVFHSGTFPRDLEGKYLDNMSRVYSAADPYYPCQDIPEKYRRACYGAVPGRTRDHSTQVIFTYCNSIPEPDAVKKRMYAAGCYATAANILTTRIDADPGVVRDACRIYSLPGYEKYCIAGAVRYTFLRNPSEGNTLASRLCAIVATQDKSVCYTALGAVVYESFYSNDRLVSYCTAVAPKEYTTVCIHQYDYLK